MTPGAYAFIAFFVFVILGIVYAVLTAPDGYQDCDGFHYGAGVDEWEDGV